MKIFIVCLAFTLSAINGQSQRKYSYCIHSYCGELHIYTPQYSYFTPAIVQVALNDTEVNPARRLVCETENESARKFYKAGFDSLVRIRPIPSLDKLDWRGERMKMALIYFRGAIKSDPEFCDAYDQLINCYFRLYQYDSVWAVLNRQANPSFHSKMAKGALLYNIEKNYGAAEEYFTDLLSRERIPIFYYYLIQSQIKQNKLEEAKINAAEMEKCLVEWGDGWAMMEKKMFVLAVAYCKEGKFDDAFPLLDRIKRQYDYRPDWCHYYGLSMVKKTNPQEKKGQKYLERAVELKYNPETML